MNVYKVKVVRELVLAVEASSEEHAQNEAFVIAWNWQPAQASNGDQGIVETSMIDDVA